MANIAPRTCKILREGTYGCYISFGVTRRPVTYKSTKTALAAAKQMGFRVENEDDLPDLNAKSVAHLCTFGKDVEGRAFIRFVMGKTEFGIEETMEFRGGNPFTVANKAFKMMGFCPIQPATNLQSGIDFIEDVGTPGYLSPSSEAYWN